MPKTKDNSENYNDKIASVLNFMPERMLTPSLNSIPVKGLELWKARKYHEKRGELPALPQKDDLIVRHLSLQRKENEREDEIRKGVDKLIGAYGAFAAAENARLASMVQAYMTLTFLARDINSSYLSSKKT